MASDTACGNCHRVMDSESSHARASAQQCNSAGLSTAASDGNPRSDQSTVENDIVSVQLLD